MSLNAAQFQKSLIYECADALGSVREDMQLVRDLDNESERLQAKWRNIAIVAFLGGFGVLLWGAGSGDTEGFAIGAAALLGALFVYSLVTYFRVKRTNVDNRRYELVSKLVGLVGVDLDRSQPLATRIDFRAVNAKDKFVRKGKAGTWNVRYFSDPWLRLSGRLLDGTSFDLVQTELLQMRSKTKRSASGKMKHKSKKKAGFELELRLRFKPSKYRHMATLKVDAEQAVQLPPPVEMKRMRYTDREIGLRVACKGGWSVNDPGGDSSKALGSGTDAEQVAAMMFLSLYQVLNLSKAIDKSTPESTQEGGAE